MIIMATYTNLSASAIRRISNERIELEQDRERLGKEEGVYFYWNPDSIDRDYKQLLIGPEDTPYEGGFFFFEATFCDQYPLYPMKMSAKTQGLGFRQHPNYYTEGKCCLSILNTWQGPPWSPALKISKVALTMKSIFTKNPLQNEPGYASKPASDPICMTYEIQVEYWTLLVAVIHMLREPPRGFEVFLPICREFFMNNYQKYMERINNLRPINLSTHKVYNCSLAITKHQLRLEYEDMYKILTNLTKPAKPIQTPSNAGSANNETTSVLSVSGDTRPSSSAKLFDEGTTVITKDGRKWMVKNSNGKRWVLA